VRNSMTDTSSFAAEKKMCVCIVVCFFLSCFVPLNCVACGRSMQGLLWTAVVCFIVEYVGLFLGASMFSPTLNSSYIMLHFVGAILTTLFYVQASGVALQLLPNVCIDNMLTISLVHTACAIVLHYHFNRGCTPLAVLQLWQPLL
jgi:hypothetical protein